MGVLQRLEKEAREARQRRSAEAGAREQRDAAVGNRVLPVLEMAARYLDSMVSHLPDLDRQIEAHYRVERVGDFESMRQNSYRVVRPEEANGAVQLRFSCIGPKPLEGVIEGHPQAQALARSLREAGLSCHLRPVSDKAMRLRVDAKVPVRVSFVPDRERGCVWVELHNLAALGIERYPMAPERIDAKLLDAVASLVIREPSDFAALTGSVVEDGQREELQRRLAREGRQRDAELAGGVQRLTFPVVEWFRRQFLGG